jgi:ureidoglycolate lyase
MMDQVVIDYLNPDIPAGLKILDVPLVRASPKSLKGYGEIVRDPHAHRIEMSCDLAREFGLLLAVPLPEI